MPKCDTCSKDFTLEKNLIRHLRSVHNLIINNKTKRGINTKEANHKCPVCQLAFVERSSLRRHERLKHKMNITASLRSKKCIKCITFEPSNLEDYTLLKKLLPEDYVYKVNHMEDLEDDKFRAKFEIADCTEDMFFVWLSKLEQKSKVTYRVKSFTKSPSPKIVFNKVFRCVHNTFPSKYNNPHPKHTGCLATLTIRITKCSEALSVRSTKSNNNMILIPHKAIVTLYHNHNHFSLDTLEVCFTEKKQQTQMYYKMQCDETILNHNKTKNKLNKIHSNKSNSQKSMSSSQVSVELESNESNKSSIEVFEETFVPYKSEHNSFFVNENIQGMSNGNNDFELSEEFDNYILVKNVNTENSLHNDDSENELYQLLSSDMTYDTAHERKLQQ